MDEYIKNQHNAKTYPAPKLTGERMTYASTLDRLLDATSPHREVSLAISQMLATTIERLGGNPTTFPPQDIPEPHGVLESIACQQVQTQITLNEALERVRQLEALLFDAAQVGPRRGDA